MTVRVKRRHRLVVLMVSTAILIGVVTSAYFFRVRQLRNRALEARGIGIQALESGNYFDALHSLGRYLQEFPNDAEVIYHYAQARLQVKESNGKHFVQSIGTLRRLLQLQPDHREAQRELLRIYRTIGYQNETLDTADTILEKEKFDVEAIRAKMDALIALRQSEKILLFADELLNATPQAESANKIKIEAIRARTIALIAQHRFVEALPLSEDYNRLSPFDFDGHLLTFNLLTELQHPAEDLVSRAAELRHQYPENSQFELLQAISYRMSGDRSNSIKWLRAVAERKPTDEILVRKLVAEMDIAGLAQEATSLVQMIADQIDDVSLRRTLASRLIQGDQLDALINMIEKTQLNGDSADSDSELLGLHALALSQLDRKTEALDTIQILASRGDDPVANAWVLFYNNVLAQEDPSGADIVKYCQDALRQYPRNSFFLYFLGHGYASLGESDLAIGAWRKASYLAPAWPKPLQRTAQLLLAKNQVQAAIQTAEAAYQSAPNNIESAITFAVAVATRLESITDDKLKYLLDLVNQIQKVQPLERHTLAIQIRVLVRLGQHNTAKEILQKVLQAEAPLEDTILLQLAEISKESQLGMHQELEQLYQQMYGQSPGSIYRRAVSLLAEGNDAEGLQILESAASQADIKQKTTWNLAIGQYLDVSQHPRAQSFWTRLADDTPEDLQTQQMTVQSRAAWKDLDLIDRTIKRLKNLTTENGTTWRVARAKWLIAQSSGEADLTKVIDLLSDVVRTAPTLVEPRVLLARCYETLGNHSGAIEQLSQANQLLPESLEIMLNLATVYQARRDFDKANIYIKRITSEEVEANPDQIRRTAILINQQGESDRATELLEKAYERGHQEPVIALPLARLYLQRKDVQNVKKLCRKLLESPTPEAVRFAAQFYATQGDNQKAQQALSLLDQLDLAPGIRERLLADHYANFVGKEQALEQYRAATQAAPDRSVHWHTLIAYQIRTDQIQQATDTIREALKSVPNDPSLKVLADHADLILATGDVPRLRPIILALFGDEETRSIAIETLKLLSDQTTNGISSDHVLLTLHQLANSHTSFLVLQNLVAQMLIEAQQFSDAIMISTRTMEAFPIAVEPARLAVTAMAGAGRWEEALVVANQWRQRSVNATLAPDLMIAEAKLRLGDTRSASAQLEPYLDEAMKQPLMFAQLIVRYTRTLIVNGDTAKAAEILIPLLEQSPTYRLAWMQLAALAIPNHDEAASWLDQVESYLPSNSPEEQTTLSSSWNTLAARSKSSSHRQKAKRIIAETVKHPNVSANGWFLYAVLAEQDGELDAANSGYRKAIEINTEHQAARNNLAMILTTNDSHLDEALALARTAVASEPKNPYYHDTLAFVQTKIKDYDAALASIKVAISLDPTNPQWQERLANIESVFEREETISGSN